MDLDVEWSASSFRITPGRDPLGMQTITTDRIMPELTPGILALSQRARYFSFHLFLLDEYEKHRLPVSREQMSNFFRRREYELALATSLCTHGCPSVPGIAVVGRQAIANPGRDGNSFTRNFSVESAFGAYGLYYRSPLITMGLAVPAGSLLGDEPTPVDVVERSFARDIADAFRARVEETVYFREFMHSGRSIPDEVLAEYAEHACLCRIKDAPIEQELLRRAFFEDRDEIPPQQSRQRLRAFALFLMLLSGNPSVVTDPSSSPFRAAVWSSFLERQSANLESPLSDSLGEWAALVAREALQEAVSSIWTDFCKLGLEQQDVHGLSNSEIDTMIGEAVAATPIEFPDGTSFHADPTEPLGALAAAAVRALSEFHVEGIRNWIARYDSIAAGLAALVAVRDRLPEVVDAPQGWRHIGLLNGASQPGLLEMTRLLESWETEAPTLGEFARKVVRTLVLYPHEGIASTKLPEFTFRFRRADGRLRFYEKTMRRHFGPSDIRHASLRWLSEDLGLWSQVDGVPLLTEKGSELVQEAFG